ncbi:motility associated factor glycosyltransferase family protein, partial [Clostridium neonatale]|uniref:motility associated factor glycosyltransferase family protein n=1 Tax=Clostridium neonatale TaxID=137838 RepID=UPI003D3552ED
VNPEIFNLPNVNIVDSNNENFYNLLSEKISLVNGIIIHKPSLDTIRESNSKLFNLINDFNNIRQLAKLDTVNSEISEKNKIYNSSKNYPLINELLVEFQKNKKPFLIVSAGPSIDCQMKLLSEYKDKFVIICVGSALKTLMNNRIIPDAIVIIDPKEIVKKQIDGYENLNVPLCFPASASRWAIDKYNGSKYIFGNLQQDDLIRVGGTVAISAIDIGIKSNAKEIVLIGQDLAYFNENSHTSTYKEIYGFSDKEKKHHIVKKAKSVYGDLIETCDGYLIFKRKIEQFISKYEYIKFINCSHGLEIEGTKFVEFEEYIDKNFE